MCASHGTDPCESMLSAFQALSIKDWSPSVYELHTLSLDELYERKHAVETRLQTLYTKLVGFKQLLSNALAGNFPAELNGLKSASGRQLGKTGFTSFVIGKIGTLESEIGEETKFK